MVYPKLMNRAPLVTNEKDKGEIEEGMLLLDGEAKKQNSRMKVRYFSLSSWRSRETKKRTEKGVSK